MRAHLISSYIKRPIVKKITVIGLLFLFIETKELCEAWGKCQCSAYYIYDYEVFPM